MKRLTMKLNKDHHSYSVCCDGRCICKAVHKPMAKEVFSMLLKMLRSK